MSFVEMSPTFSFLSRSIWASKSFNLFDFAT